mgnify:FL=1
MWAKVILACALCIAAIPSYAVTLLRDAEVERGLRSIAQPIFQAAGLSASRTKILLVDNQSLNAFVIDGSAIFIHSGLIMRMGRVEELQAVIAHEAAHIANGHLARRAANFQNARTAAGIGTALSLIVGAAAGSPEAGAAAAVGSSGSALRRFFGHTRAEESSADQSGGRYMVRAGIDPSAAVDVMRLFRGQEALNIGRQDPYVRTHPLTRDRIRALEAFAAGNAGDYPTPALNAAWFEIIQGKISAYSRAPSWTLRRTRGQNDHVALMRQAIAHHRKPDRNKTRATLKRLVAKAPDNPYVHELDGQLKLEGRDFDAAVAAYGRAVRLAPNEPLILGGYGRALLAVGQNAKARDTLERARARDPLDGRILRDLGTAYAKTGNNGMASLSIAERYALRGRLKDAAIHANRAAGLLPRGSAPWQRANDVLAAAKTSEKGKR